MSVPRDSKGNVLVTVGDLIEYLHAFPQALPVVLDHDGWLDASDPGPETVQQLIKERGVFQFFSKPPAFLCINN